MRVRNNEEDTIWQVRITDGYNINEQDVDTDEPISLFSEDYGERTVTLAELMEDYSYEGEDDL